MKTEVKTIKVPIYLKDLIPGYYKRMLNSITKIEEYLETSSYDEIYKISHSIAGNAESYGFGKCGDICADINEQIFESEFSVVDKLVVSLRSEASNVEFLFIEDDIDEVI